MKHICKIEKDLHLEQIDEGLIYVWIKESGVALFNNEALKLRDALIEKYPLDSKPQSLWEDE